MTNLAATSGSSAGQADPYSRPFISGSAGHIKVYQQGPKELVQQLSVKLHSSGTCTDAKVLDGGTKIAALVGEFAGVISYPDGEIVFRTPPCKANEHAVEVIPGPYLATADSDGQGIRVYSQDGGLTGRLVQDLPLESAHGLRWDARRNVLWAIGANKHPKVPDSDPAEVFGILAAFPYQPGAAKPLGEPTIYRMRNSPKLSQSQYPQLSKYKGWRDGPHDLAPIPKSSKLLISTDAEIFEFDIDSAKPTDPPERNFALASKGYLTGFAPRRTGDGMCEMKSISVSSFEDVMLCQADDDYRSTHLVSFAPTTRARTDLKLPSATYKAKWLEEPPGWPGAKY